MLKWLSRLFNRKSDPKQAERKKSVERLILNHQRRLQKLKEYQDSPNIPTVPPHILLEIEDIELNIQQLQTELVNGRGDKAKTEAVLAAHQRRLESLRKIAIGHKHSDYGQEIEEIEAKIEQLQAELKNLSC